MFSDTFYSYQRLVLFLYYIKLKLLVFHKHIIIFKLLRTYQNKQKYVMLLSYIPR